MPSPTIVFYLKYAKSDDAVRMLAELLDGGDAATEFEAGTLVNGYVSSGTSLLGSLVTSRDGTITLTSVCPIFGYCAITIPDASAAFIGWTEIPAAIHCWRTWDRNR